MNDQAKMTLLDTIAPKSDQLNYDDLLNGDITVTVTGLSMGSPDQPVCVKIQNAATGQPMRDYKPCKSMRRVLIAAWGDKGKNWIGKSMVLYGDGAVRFGGVEVGGIRIRALSGISDALTLKLTTTRSKRAEYVVAVLQTPKQPAADATAKGETQA